MKGTSPRRFEESPKAEKERGPPLVQVVLLIVSTSLIGAIILIVAGDFVVHISVGEYQIYKAIYVFLLFFLAFASIPVAKRIPRDGDVVMSNKGLVLASGIVMVVVFMALFAQSSVRNLGLLSPMKGQMPVLAISEGLSIFCFFFGAYCISLARRGCQPTVFLSSR
ncbi:MAG: hypothetical protein ACE5QW_09530 [Thermoplasmata archaeon]